VIPKRASLSIAFLFCMAVIHPLSALELNGAAVYEELGQELFIASLYVNAPNKDPVALRESLGHRRMEIHIASPIARRRWINLWMQSIAINNSTDILGKWGPDLLDVFDAHKGDLEAGDIVVIEYDSANGTVYQINGQTLIKGKPKTLFDLFLSTWLGIVPPSTDFRLGMLGLKGDPASLEVRSKEIIPSQERRKVVSGWVTPIEPPPSKISPPPAKTQTQAKTPAPKKTPVPAKPPAPPTRQVATLIKPKMLVDAPEKQETQEPEIADINLDQDVALDQPLEETESITLTDEKEAAEAAKEAEEVEAEAERAAKKAAKEAAKAVKEAERKLALEILQAHQAYTQQLIAKLYKEINYPLWSIRNDQQGSVRLVIKLNRDGSVANVLMVERTFHPGLNNEVKRAALAAAPYGPIPDNFSDDMLEFIIPIAFKLPK